MRTKLLALLSLGAAGLVPAATAQEIPLTRIDIDVAQEKAEIAPTMYGVFFEDINRSADGGIYAELIFNRGFEEANLPSGCTYNPGDKRVYAPHKSVYSSPEHLRSWSIPWNIEDKHPGWTVECPADGEYSVRIDDTDHLGVEASKAMYLTIDRHAAPFRLVNSGFYGLAVEAGKKYDLRFYIKAAPGYKGGVTAEILTAQNEVIASKRFTLKGDGEWKYFEAVMKPSQTMNDGRFALRFDSAGALEIDYVSLFPQETFHNRSNGLRRDVAQFVADLKPAFMRWPGGCIVEGLTLDNRVKWKETIGDPVKRPGEYNLWGYRSTYGFGYHEFLQFCEDIGAEGMFVCNVGLGCQGRAGDACPEEEVDFFINDALDAIDYALGDGTTAWSRKRVENGHPEPFPLKYVEIGNENWGPVYEKRHDKFYKAIKAKYPQLKLISTLGLGGQHRHEKVDMIDPHWYVSPEFFFASDKLFDQQERGDYEIYIGEYAVNQNVGGGNLLGALAEAAFLTGVERNSDLVKMASYAPLLENVNDRVWPTNLIWFDSHRVMGRSSYQVQKMYAENRPSFNVATAFEQPTHPVEVRGRIALGGWNTDNEYKDLKVTLADGRTVEADMTQGWTPQEGSWTAGEGTLKGSGPGVMRWILWSTPEAFGDCSISLKARKTAGAEGFLIYFGMHDGLNGYVLNIGGWGNQTTAFQRIDGNDMPQIPNNISQHVEEGRWYDIRIDVKGGKFTYYLDGKQMLETTIENIQRYVVSGYDENAGELIVKFVNATEEPFTTSINLQNVTSVEGRGKVVTLTSADPKDENTLEDPKKVFPRESTYNGFSERFDYTFEPWSLTVLRIKAEI